MSLRIRILIITISAALLFGVAMAVHWRAIPHGGVTDSAAALKGLKAQIIRCELGARETEAVLKVYVRLRNEGTVPVRIGPGSFWILDAESLPYLDRYAAENPDKPPLKLTPGETGPEMELKFILPSSSVVWSLMLLIGEPPTGKVAGSPPPSKGIRVLLKEKGAPKGPFVEGDWKTYVGTRWR